MKITVRKFTANDTKDWDDFVKRSNNGTLFHLRSFLSYHIDRKFTDHSLIFEKNGELIALFPATFEKKDGKNILYSHPGASFGGFVFQNLSFEDANMLVKTIDEYSKQNKFEKIFEKTQKFLKCNCLKARFKFDIASAVMFQNHLKTI